MNCKKESCGAYAMKNSAYCFAHNPETKARHLDAVKKGGKVGSRTQMELEEPLDLSDTKVLLELLQDTINKLRVVGPNVAIDIKTANTIGFLSSKIVEIKKQMALEPESRTIVDLKEYQQWLKNKEDFSEKMELNPLKTAASLLESSIAIYHYEIQNHRLKGETDLKEGIISEYYVKQLQKCLKVFN